MPGGLDSTDRKLLLAAVAVALLMAAGTVALAPVNGGSQSKVPSTYSAGAAGARAAYLLLQKLHYHVRRWQEPPAALAELNQPAILILAEPDQLPTAGERSSLLKFVRNGGRILFCGDALPSFFPGTPVSSASAGQEWTNFSAIVPSFFTRSARTITMDPKSSWTQLNPQQLALYGDENAPVAVAWQIGDGELLWWAAPTPLSNAGISQTGNLNLVLNAVTFPQRSADVYWDEYFHGERGSLWSYVAGTPVKWALVQFAILTAAILFTFSRRWGPVAQSRPVSRLSPLEFVDTLGGLYQRAGASSVATTVAYRHLRLNLTRRLGLPSAMPDDALAHTAGERLGWNIPQLTTTLQTAASAQTGNLTPKTALNLVQQIGTYANRLESNRAPQENH